MALLPKAVLYMNSDESVTPQSTTDETPLVRSSERDYWWSAFLLFMIGFLVHLIFSEAIGRNSTSAEHFGSVSAFVFLALGSAVVFAFILNAFGEVKKWWDVRGKIAGSLFLVGIFWVWRAVVVAEAQQQRLWDSERASELKEDLAKYEQLGVRAEPVLAYVRKSVENEIKDRLRGIPESVEVVGWSAAEVSGTKWLVKFEYKIDENLMWRLFEYDAYLEVVKSVFGDERMMKKYFDGSDSFVGGDPRWYGPLK